MWEREPFEGTRERSAEALRTREKMEWEEGGKEEPCWSLALNAGKVEERCRGRRGEAAEGRARPRQQFQCENCPLGLMDPGREVCAFADRR